jgi:hypothetical protein
MIDCGKERKEKREKRKGKNNGFPFLFNPSSFL